MIHRHFSYSPYLPNNEGVICGGGISGNYIPPEICLSEVVKEDKALIELKVLKRM